MIISGLLFIHDVFPIAQMYKKLTLKCEDYKKEWKFVLLLFFLLIKLFVIGLKKNHIESGTWS